LNAPAQLPSSFNTQRLLQALTPQSRYSSLYAWDLEQVRAARDAQMLGDFRLSAELAEAAKTDASVFSALLNRLAPHKGLPIRFAGSRRRIVAEAERIRPLALPRSAINDAFEREVMIGVGIAQIHWTQLEQDGRVARLVPTLVPWPMRSAYVERHTGDLKAITDMGAVDVVHGDGKWVVFKQHSQEPWQWGAAKAIALSWVDRAFGIRDRSQNAETHGMAKILAELPADVELDSPDGLAVQELVETLRYSRSGGVFPSGTVLQLLESTGQGWQIFRELIRGDDSDIARVLLGQDGTVKNEGGNYIKATQLFGVRNDLVEGDLSGAADALNTGFWRPWSMLNFGIEDAVTMSWEFPDPDQDARRSSLAEHTRSYNEAIGAYRGNGFIVDQQFADALAAEFGVMAPSLSQGAEQDAGE
jgi:hypothetical protein